jgi:hypothetical protein
MSHLAICHLISQGSGASRRYTIQQESRRILALVSPSVKGQVRLEAFSHSTSLVVLLCQSLTLNSCFHSWAPV